MTNALFLGTQFDKPYTAHLKGLFNGLSTYVITEPVEYLTLLEQYCAKRSVTKIVSTNTTILKKLLESQGLGSGKTPSLSNYEGSLFTHKNLEIVFISPLAQLFTVPYGKFLAARYISKVVNPSRWIEATPFQWEVLTASNLESFYAQALAAFAISVDIETFRSPLSIRCIGYTCILVNDVGGLYTKSGVLPLTDLFALAWMRKLNDVAAPKIFQRGKYDNSYLLRYGAPVRNWLWDTANAMHCWYSELPKDLAFLNAFFLRKVVYWKDLSETHDLHEYYKYNAMDTWATANVWISWMLEAPDWAKRNYALEFPLVFPCLLAEMTGIKRDEKALLTARREVDVAETRALSSLRKSLGNAEFNPNSPKQVVQLLKILGCKDIESSGEQELNKAAYRHPLIGRLLTQVLDIRGFRKLRSTYLRTDDDAVKSGIHSGESGAKEFNGTILYSLNPDGTDTGRLASREHHFWCGLQIQNIPGGPQVRQTIRAPDGFHLGECDLEQAESRDTAYISGDTALIGAVSGTSDFHSTNASAFFGIPYRDIYDDITKKTRNKKIRNLAKRINHGATYVMGPGVLVDTMGLKEIWEARELLKLPFTSPLVIAEYLLLMFHRTYNKLRGHIHTKSSEVLAYLGMKQSSYKMYAPGSYYAAVAEQISVSKMLVSRAFHHTEYNRARYMPENYIELRGDWTRYCFGNPTENKLDLNAYVAHGPQSLNARTLNEAFMRVFYDIALPNPTTFRLHAQIHDSILFSYAAGYERHAEAVQKCLEIPVTVRDISGTHRTFTVPAALKLGITQPDGTLKRAVYWSEIE